MIAIAKEAAEDADKLKAAPISTVVRRLDDVKAARSLDLAYKPDA